MGTSERSHVECPSSLSGAKMRRKVKKGLGCTGEVECSMCRELERVVGSVEEVVPGAGRWALKKEVEVERKVEKALRRGREVVQRPAKMWILWGRRAWVSYVKRGRGKLSETTNLNAPFILTSCWIRTWFASTIRVTLPGSRRCPAMSFVPGGLNTPGFGYEATRSESGSALRMLAE
jgi:hypothetical protein